MTAFLVVVSGPAWAGMLDIAGTYGNPEGCRYARTSDYSEEAMTLLTAEHYQTYVTYCEFLQALPADDGSRVVTMLCGHEGEADQTIEFMRVARDANGADAYDLFDQQGGQRGRVERCP